MKAIYVAALAGCFGTGAACDNAAPMNKSASAPPRSVEDPLQSESSAAVVRGDAGAPAVSKPASMEAPKTASQLPAAADAGRIASAAAGTRGDEADAGVSTALPDLCSGCAQESRDTNDMTVHLHHVHLNVMHRDASTQFYQKYFHAQRVMLNGTTEALHVAPTLILLDEQPRAPDSKLPTALQHMGWGAADPGVWYAAAHGAGIEPDTRGFTLFNTNDTPTIGDSGSGAILGLTTVPACFPIPDALSYIYVLGPDNERIEVWSGAEGRVNHLHFTTADLAATSGWYQRFLGLPSATPLLSYQFFLDDIVFFYEAIGAASDYNNTDDHVLAHVALAVSDLEAWRKRAQEQNIEVVSEPSAAHGFTSFFVRGPDGLLIELVQAAKYPELCPTRM